MLNSVVLIGRLGKDPELRYTTGGKAVCAMRIAVDRGATDAGGQREVDWLDVIAWERQAETCSNYLQKGRLIAVQGRLQVRNFETSEGQKREKVEVVANRVDFLDKGTDAPAGGGSMGGEPNFGDDEDPPF